MTRVLWVLAAIAGIAAVRYAVRPSDVAVVENARGELVAGCMRRGAAGSPVPPERLDAFCACAAGRVVAELGPDRLRALADDPGGFDADRMAALSVECFHEVVGAPTPQMETPEPSTAAVPSPGPTTPVPASTDRPGGAKRAQGGRSGGSP